MTILSSSAWKRHMAVGIVALLLLPSFSSAVTPPNQGKTKTADKKLGNEETQQPKFIWGILIKYVASQVSDMFTEWVKEKINQGIERVMTIALGDAVSPPGAATLGRPTRKDASQVEPNITDIAPSVPLVVANGKENYQGVFLSLLVLQPDGQSFTVRPISAGFKSGEKFRIRMGATFNGELSIDNVNPHKERSHLYPDRSDQVVKIKSGTPVILPLEKDSFFQFDDDAGEENLIITLRDPRAQGDAAAQSLVHRQENEQGTGLLQEVTAGKYPAIAESIAFQHRQ